MGILNATPDSFFDGNPQNTTDLLIKKAVELAQNGADILDIGAQSTRPQANYISAQKEWERLQPVLEGIRFALPEMPISIDTFYAHVAEKSIAAGAHIINDVSGGTLDKNMFATVAEMRVPYVLMHMRGTPKTMQNHTQYTNVVADVITDLSKKIDALHRLGQPDIVVDPGFGFAKTVAQNFELLRNLENLQILEKPLLVGISRKSMICKTLCITPKDALNGTTALHAFALQNGASILRVHDVKQAKEVISLHKALHATCHF